MLMTAVERSNRKDVQVSLALSTVPISNIPTSIKLYAALPYQLACRESPCH